MNDNGWGLSADAWIAEMGDHGDWSRRTFLDNVMLTRVRASSFRQALDVGCGEGRFSRLLHATGIQTTGIDPTERLLEVARLKHPEGEYHAGIGENLPFAAESFDLVVSYLSLIDIERFVDAIHEMSRVLKPGGCLLFANLTSFATASRNGWQYDEAGAPTHFILDNYLEEKGSWESWRGIRIMNWHRPLSSYMRAFLATGLTLTYFDEPAPIGSDSPMAAECLRIPWFVVMEWRKPPCYVIDT